MLFNEIFTIIDKNPFCLKKAPLPLVVKFSANMLVISIDLLFSVSKQPLDTPKTLKNMELVKIIESILRKTPTDPIMLFDLLT